MPNLPLARNNLQRECVGHGKCYQKSVPANEMDQTKLAITQNGLFSSNSKRTHLETLEHGCGIFWETNCLQVPVLMKQCW